MSAPILVFKNPHTTRRLSALARTAAERLDALFILDANRGESALLFIDVLLRRARASRRLEARRRARNIGKPVITVERDDREGA